MSNKIPCSIIRDIVPLYVDDLTSSETKKIIEEHFQECDNCRMHYDVLTKEFEEKKINNDDMQVLEIKYMKKINAYQKGNLILGAIISFLLGLSIPVLRIGMPIIFGSKIPDYYIERLQVAWHIGILKMIISGIIVCSLYIIIDMILRKRRVR